MKNFTVIKNASASDFVRALFGVILIFVLENATSALTSPDAHTYPILVAIITTAAGLVQSSIFAYVALRAYRRGNRWWLALDALLAIFILVVSAYISIIFFILRNFSF